MKGKAAAPRAAAASSDDEAERIVTALESAEPLEHIPFAGIHSVRARAGDVDAALEGTYRLRDLRFRLSPPVDWWDEPYRFPDERGFFQNSFVFADPLLADPRFPELLPALAALCVDWLASHPRESLPHPHRYAWHDHAAAARIVVMAFVLREGVRRGAIDRATAKALAAGVGEHARYLLAEENYAARHNHGFWSDAALMLAARSVAPFSQAERWSEVAERRFATILDHMIDRAEAIHLEHSPFYHWIIHGALSRLAAAGLFEGLRLETLALRMEEAGAWLTAPDGTLPPLGDTPAGQRPPRAAARSARGLRGMRVFAAAGYAVVKDGPSSLIVTAAHHPTAHKHADDGSFCLYEDGRPLVLDRGGPGYEYESAEFRYGTSPGAHAGVCVDGFDWSKERAAYGSGIVASAQEGDLHALLTRNPHAVPGGGAARRLLVYRPRRFLLVLDDVDAEPNREIVRTVPLAPGLRATLRRPGSLAIVDRASAIATLVQLPAPRAELDEVELSTGVRTPSMRGFSFPSPEDPVASCDVDLRGPGGHAKAYALLFDPDESIAPRLTCDASGDSVGVEIAGLPGGRLQLRFDDESLDLGSPE